MNDRFIYREEKYVEYKHEGDNRIVFPYILINGAKDGPKVCITAGIHGCEYPPIASAIALSKKLNPKKLKGIIKIIPVVDMKAFKNKSMFVCPEDNKNINRCFPGKKKGSYSEVLTYHLFNSYIKDSDYYIDLHSADLTEAMIPFCEIHKSKNDDINAISFNMAKYSGLSDIVVKSSSGEINDKNQSYSTAADIGIPSLVINAGKANENIENYIDIYLNGLLNILTYLKCIEGNVKDTDNYACYEAPIHIRAKQEGTFYHNYKIGDKVSQGDMLGRIEDIFGNELEIIKAPVEGKVLLINTCLWVNKNALLLELIVKKKGNCKDISKNNKK